MTVWADTPLTDIESVLWTLDHDPELRPTITAVAFCSGRVELRSLRHRLDRAARIVPRLRQRVVSRSSADPRPCWSVDPGFALSYHLRTCDLGGTSPSNDVLDLAADLTSVGLDRSRPLWECTLVRGLDHGDSALILRAHHALTDGIGGIQMMLEIFDVDTATSESEPPLPPVPVEPEASAQASDNTTSTSRVAAATAGIIRTVAAGRQDATDIAYDVGRALGPLARAWHDGSTKDRVLPASTTGSRSFRAISVAVSDLRAAGSRVGGTLNDAFVAAVVLGLTGSEHFGGGARPVRILIPVSTRREFDDHGNHFTAVPIEIRTDTLTPDPLMREVRKAVDGARNSLGAQLVQPVAALARLMPSVVLTDATRTLARGFDLAISNVPGGSSALHLCGRPVHTLVPFGPLQGTEINITLASHGNVADIGVVSDPRAVADPDNLKRALRDGLRTVINQ